MRWLLFLSRAALICNIFFFTCIVLRYVQLPLYEGLKGFIIIVGYPLSIVLNTVVNFRLLSIIIGKKSSGLPQWLATFNLLSFIIQIAYLLLF